MSNTALELREKANLCRLAANVTSDGGKEADRLLIGLAARLDREAETLERLGAALEQGGIAG